MASEITRASTLYHGFSLDDELLEREVWEGDGASWRISGSYAVVVVEERLWLWK